MEGLVPAVLHAVNAAGGLPYSLDNGAVGPSISPRPSLPTHKKFTRAILPRPFPAGASLGSAAVTHSAAAAASSAGAAAYAKMELRGVAAPAELAQAGKGKAPLSDTVRTPTHEEGNGPSPTPAGVLSFNSSLGSASLEDPDAPVIDVRAVVGRLQATPLTGQVVAWAWDQAAALSAYRRAPPVQLLAALWPATESCAGRCTAQDVLEMFDAWLVLLQRWPRHFSLRPAALELLTSVTVPAAVKRMPDSRLMQLTATCAGIAQLRVDPALSLGATPRAGSPPAASARDMMQPIFALVAAEVAWRTVDPVRYVSPAALRALLSASSAWRWTAVPGRDSAALVAIKESTRAALAVIREALERAEAEENEVAGEKS